MNICLSSSIKTSSGEELAFRREKGEYRAALSFAGVVLNAEVSLHSPLPLARAIENLHSAQPTVAAQLRERDVVWIVPKGGLRGGGKPLMDYLGAFEGLVNIAENGEKIIEALNEHGIDPAELPPNYALEFLGVVADILDPMRRFEGFTEALGEAAEERLEEFALRLTSARAVQEAWIQQYWHTRDQNQLSSFISRTHRLISEKEAELRAIEREVVPITREIAEKQQRIRSAEATLNQPRDCRSHSLVCAPMSKLLEDKRRIEDAIRECDRLLSIGSNSYEGQQELRRTMELKRKAQEQLAFYEDLIQGEERRLRLRGELVRKVNRAKADLVKPLKQKNELVRRSNRLRHQIRMLQHRVEAASEKLSQMR